MQKFSIMDIIMWLIVAAMIVLIITHAKDFNVAVSSVGTNLNSTLGNLEATGTATNV